MLNLYYAAHTCALATHIVLEEVGADYTTTRIDFGSAQQRSPEYLKVNPKGRVPALVTDRGILTETPAMLAFVAQSFPKQNLALMDDAFAFAEVQAFNSYLCSHLHIAHAHRMRGHRWVDPDDTHSIAAMQRKVPESVGSGFAYIESDLLKGPWVMGERFTVCDAYLFILAQWLEADGVVPSRIPKVIDHRRRMSERATVAKVIAAELA
jgi:glutathione S-transferase